MKAGGSSAALNCPHCGEPVPLTVWGFHPLTKLLVCRSCSRLSRFPTYARVWGIGVMFVLLSIELLVIKDLGLWEPHGFSGLFTQAGLFLFVMFSSSLAGSLVCRKFATALVP